MEENLQAGIPVMFCSRTAKPRDGARCPVSMRESVALFTPTCSARADRDILFSSRKVFNSCMRSCCRMGNDLSSPYYGTTVRKSPNTVSRCWGQIGILSMNSNTILKPNCLRRDFFGATFIFIRPVFQLTGRCFCGNVRLQDDCGRQTDEHHRQTGTNFLPDPIAG